MTLKQRMNQINPPGLPAQVNLIPGREDSRHRLRYGTGELQLQGWLFY
tara:strand:+ start:144 stop:287 length:144 start_codon:yes stop_codon:yes gene_type:complete